MKNSKTLILNVFDYFVVNLYCFFNHSTSIIANNGQFEY